MKSVQENSRQATSSWSIGIVYLEMTFSPVVSSGHPIFWGHEQADVNKMKARFVHRCRQQVYIEQQQRPNITLYHMIAMPVILFGLMFLPSGYSKPSAWSGAGGHYHRF